MARKVRPYWTCRGCGFRNLRANQKCRGEGCKRSKPKKRVPKHAIVLRDTPYDQYAEFSVAVHGGELDSCACCRRRPTKVKHYDRDHDHYTGKARGIACYQCNHWRLKGIKDAEEARWVFEYLQRVEDYYRQTEEEE